MKKDVKYTLFALLTVVSMAFAGNGEKESKSKTVRLTVSQLQGFDKIKVKDAFGVILYSGEVAEVKIQQFDFSSLAAGAYVVELDSEVKTVSYPLNITADSAALALSDKTEIYKPFASFENGQLTLMGFNPDREAMQIFIYNGEGDIIFSETVNNTNELKRAYQIQGYNGDGLSVKVMKNKKSFDFGF